MLETWSPGDGSSLIQSIRQSYAASDPQEIRNCFYCDLEAGQGAAAGQELVEEPSGDKGRCPGSRCRGGYAVDGFTNTWDVEGSLGCQKQRGGESLVQEMGPDGNSEG